MAYTYPFSDSGPTDAAQDANKLATKIREEKLMLVERLMEILGISDFSDDPLVVTKLTDALSIVDGVGVDVTGQGRSIQNDAGNSGTSKTIDFDDGNNQKLTLTGNVTLTLSNPRAGASYLLYLVQDGSGGRSITFPSTVRWAGGTTPTFVTTANRASLVGLFYNGSVYLATLIGTNYNVS